MPIKDYAPHDSVNQSASSRDDDVAFWNDLFHQALAVSNGAHDANDMNLVGRMEPICKYAKEKRDKAIVRQWEQQATVEARGAKPTYDVRWSTLSPTESQNVQIILDEITAIFREKGMTCAMREIVANEIARRV